MKHYKNMKRLIILTTCSPNMLVNEFLYTFNMLYNKLSSHGTTISADLLGYKLLKAADLSADHEKLAKATSELT